MVLIKVVFPAPLRPTSNWQNNQRFFMCDAKQFGFGGGYISVRMVFRVGYQVATIQLTNLTDDSDDPLWLVGKIPRRSDALFVGPIQHPSGACDHLQATNVRNIRLVSSLVSGGFICKSP